VQQRHVWHEQQARRHGLHDQQQLRRVRRRAVLWMLRWHDLLRWHELPALRVLGRSVRRLHPLRPGALLLHGDDLTLLRRGQVHSALASQRPGLPGFRRASSIESRCPTDEIRWHAPAR
jgi:hypothetical protein